MFIKVTKELDRNTMLVNANHILRVVQYQSSTVIVFTDNGEASVVESVDEIEKMLKGADDEQKRP